MRGHGNLPKSHAVRGATRKAGILTERLGTDSRRGVAGELGSEKQCAGQKPVLAGVRDTADPRDPEGRCSWDRACFALTEVVKCGEGFPGASCMKAKRVDARKEKTETMAQKRATLSFPPDVYETLKVIARQKKVSLAWVVREAADHYLADKWPLFGKRA